METTTVYATKQKTKKERIRLDSRTYHEKTPEFMSGSIAKERIGIEVERNNINVSIIQPDTSIQGVKIGSGMY